MNKLRLIRLARNKILAVTLGVATVALLAYCFVPRESTLGIDFGDIKYTAQSPWENFQYRRLIHNSVARDPAALAELVQFDCFGGAGCYDHGAVLVHILMKLGDVNFSGMAKTLDKDSKSHLRFLLAAGFEYGFPISVNAVDSELQYPLTAEVLSPLPVQPALNAAKP